MYMDKVLLHFKYAHNSYLICFGFTETPSQPAAVRFHPLIVLMDHVDHQTLTSFEVLDQTLTSFEVLESQYVLQSFVNILHSM